MGSRRPPAPRGSLVLVLLLTAACGAPDPGPTPTPSVSAGVPTTTPGTPTAVPTPATTPSPTPPPRHAVDGDLDPAGLRHDSRDLLYRTPGGAVPAGTPVTLRLRTFREDVESVKLRLFSLNSSAESIVEMAREADGVSCYEAQLAAAGDLCDWWSVTLDNAVADNAWYRFIVSDGERTLYYADDSGALDGGVGQATPAQVDNSYALTVYEPGFAAPDWAREAVVYQIFPDRFRNGDRSNDPQTGDVRYDDPVVKLDWDELPEGHCRGYAGSSGETCPWRYDDTPPSWSPDVEGPRGRDYYGGDLAGVIEQLPYLEALGVTAIYFNPIFDAGSNHGYDTQDYERIDPYFGTNELFVQLTQEAAGHGIRVILDGVFNHTSSDSAWFDRYRHYPAVGACEAVDSEWRDWYYMTGANGPCVGENGAGDANYQSWFGFDTLPILLKNQPQLRDYFIDAPGSITRRWLEAGAAGWRMDVSGDPSFPRDYWTDFRAAVQATRPDALTISETWQKDSALLRNVRGDRFDTTMNYRLRDAVLGLLAPQGFDPKGFPDSGDRLTASEFAARLLSQQEDYAPATYYTLMNLLDSHDTERILWTLTPGPENRDGRELDEENLAQGKARLRIASLIQYGLPGMPTIYYGDEVGLTGDDDPDDRRTYPWADMGAEPDAELLAHYQALAQLRRDVPALVHGDLRVLLADDDSGMLVLGRRTPEQAVIIALASNGGPVMADVPTAGFVPDGTTFEVALDMGPSTHEAPTGGEMRVAVDSAVVLVSAAGEDLAPPVAPAGLAAKAVGDGHVELGWSAVGDAAAYNVYRSPLAGGGWLRVNAEPLRDTGFRDEGLENGRLFHYVVTALDESGNESGYSNEVEATPQLSIGDARLVEPSETVHTISAVHPTQPRCAEVSLAEHGTAGPPASLRAQLGYGPAAPWDPADEDSWRWTEATYAQSTSGGAQRWCASMLPDEIGDFEVLFRFTTTNGRQWLYAGRHGASGVAEEARAGAGRLTVTPSADTQPPSAPVELRVVSATPTAIELAWQPPAGEAVVGYQVYRSGGGHAKYSDLGRTSDTSFIDGDVAEGYEYTYRVVALDAAWNPSPPVEVSATAAPALVTIVFTLTVPEPSGAAIDQTVHIAGNLGALEGGLNDWDPAATPLERVSDTEWTISLQGVEGTELEYKYTLGSWDYVEKDGSCGEIANRTLLVAFTHGDEQHVEDVVPNWRNVDPCGS